jgi:maleate isomerase
VAGVKALGASRISLISPYMPESEVHVHRYFMDHGIEILRLTSLAVQEGYEIVNVPTATLVDELKKLVSSEVQALVQIGAGMSMLRLGAEAETWLGKPVVTINAATLWHAMRTSGFKDQFRGFGSLLSEH